MNDKVLKTLLKKAIGYNADEVSEEFTVNEAGGLELTKRKVTTKYYPPDNAALKTYLELTSEKSYSDYTDDELEAEKARLLSMLRKEESKRKNAPESKTKKAPESKTKKAPESKAPKRSEAKSESPQTRRKP
ncbi:MAG TPA: hypothetical protein P5161_06685 [Eubacteriales bacterium]|jgi:hypothetical protein|nr:hypothetical protein [Clostridia bacterium]HRR90444.1 hypothetical protein [Eubacteriales bacterium]HRU84776.1 hypothetical protein [Eubacteriales bacterium]